MKIKRVQQKHLDMLNVLRRKCRTLSAYIKKKIIDNISRSLGTTQEFGNARTNQTQIKKQ